MTVDEVISKLQEAAKEGYEEILNGDVYRPELKDVDFSTIVPADMEDAVLEVMVRRDDWYRLSDGFTRRPLR